MSRVCCDHADEVIVPTDKVKKLLLSYGVQRPILVQPTGIQLSKFNMVDWEKVMKIKSKYNIESEQHVLVSIGRLSKEKNLKEIIENLGEIVKFDHMARLLIVGDGPEKTNLEELVKTKNLVPYVIFTGEVDWRKIQNYYAVGDVFTCASTSETQGLTYAEALACGKPILVREDECLRNLLKDGVNGYFYRNEKEFIEKYQLLFQNEKYQEMEFEAIKSVRNMSVKVFGRNMEHIYKNLINQEQTKRDGLYEQIHSIVG